MKVSLEGNRAEFEELAELIAFGLEYRSKLRTMSKVQANDDVPNRFREEGT